MFQTLEQHLNMRRALLEITSNPFYNNVDLKKWVTDSSAHRPEMTHSMLSSSPPLAASRHKSKIPLSHS
jgi:hypothetical protein